MNEQLRKAIEEATRVDRQSIQVGGFSSFEDTSHDFVIAYDHYASQAKLLRVIELLVEQRDGLLDEFCAISGWKTKEQMDAYIFAALEEK